MSLPHLIRLAVSVKKLQDCRLDNHATDNVKAEGETNAGVGNVPHYGGIKYVDVHQPRCVTEPESQR